MNIFPNQKMRSRFRRNALKAYVNAQCTKQHVQVLAKRDKYQRNANKTIIRPNHPNYLQQLEDKMHGVLVKHKTSSSCFQTNTVDPNRRRKAKSNSHFYSRIITQRQSFW